MNESNDPNDKMFIVKSKGDISPEQIQPGKLFFVDMDEGSIRYWQLNIYQWAESKGWNQDLSERSFGDWMALFHTEISEAYEDYRNHKSPTEVYWEANGQTYSGPIDDQSKPCGIPIEIADLAIRMLHFCEFFQIDLNEMIALKMKYNETRPHRHGNKKV